MLMSLTGTTGKDDYGNVILLDNTFSRYFVNQRVASIEPKPSVLDKHYLLHVFRNPKIKARLTSKSRGIRQANISNGDVLELELPLPPIELQREFARRVSAVEKLKAAQRASLAELDALFATLQHHAFRGEL
jgi:type I restriction enzyme S subunit